jgi:hypothetical protein
VGIPSWLGFEATTCCLRPFLVGIPSSMEFSRPQLVVVSGLFLYDGIPAIKKPFSRTLFSFFHDGILAFTKPFSRTFFLFSRWNSGYHEAFLTNFLFYDGILAIMKPFSRTFFFTMEFWLSRSLSHELSFSRWNFGYHEAFLTNILFHNGILAIMKPFSRTFFFTMEFSKYVIWGKTLFIYI